MAPYFQPPSWSRPKTFEAIEQIPQTLDAIIQRYQQAKMANEQMQYSRGIQDQERVRQEAEFARQTGGLPVEAFQQKYLEPAMQPPPTAQFAPQLSPMGMSPETKGTLNLPPGQFGAEPQDEPWYVPALRNWMENKKRQENIGLGLKAAQTANQSAQAASNLSLPQSRERMARLQEMGLLLRGQPRPRIFMREINGQVQKIVTDTSGNITGMEPLGLSGQTSQRLRDAVSTFESADGMLNEIEDASNKVITAESWTQLPEQIARITWGNLVTKNPDAVVFKNALEAFSSMLSKASGQVGVLTERDVQMIKTAFPREDDTVASMQAKLKMLRSLYENIKEGKIAAFSNPPQTTNTPRGDTRRPTAKPAAKPGNDRLGLFQ